MRPVYIICSDSGTEDKNTNLVSIFNITERILLANPPDQGQSAKTILLPLVNFHVFAVWMKEPGDEDKQFEGQFLMDSPGHGVHEFETKVFAIPTGKYLQRFKLNYSGPAFFKGSGFLRFISRVREVGTEEWTSQDYPIVVDDEREQPMLLDVQIVQETGLEVATTRVV